MIGMQYNLQGKGVLEVTGGFGSAAGWKKEKICASNEPISVLDTRSPSPSTSTSTLSSSLGGGGSAENTASLAAVTGNNPQQKWPVSLPPESGSTAVAESPGAGSRKDEWASELQPIPAGLEVCGAERFGLGLEDWDGLLSESGQDRDGLLSESGQDQSLLRWISSEADESSFSLKQLLQSANPNEFDGNVAIGILDQTSSFGPVTGGSWSSANNVNDSKIASTAPNSSSGVGNPTAVNPQFPIFGSSLNNPFPSGLIYQQQQLETPEEKPQILNPQVFWNQSHLSQVTENQNLFPQSLYALQDPILRLLQPHPKRQNLGGASDPGSSHISKPPFVDSVHEFLLRKHHQAPLVVPKQEATSVNGGHSDGHGGEQTAARNQQQRQLVYDELFKAAELILAGNFLHAQGILARLNHQLSSSVAKPFQRAAFYFKEALQFLLLISNPATPIPSKNPTPFDGIFKMGAYKLLSEISPLVQFMNFTSNQALLEAIGDSEHVHVIDFDIGFGAQWASFMQELPGKSRTAGSTALSLKITAFASPSTHHPFELSLMHENLTQFANEIGVNFELEVVNFDAFDPSSYPIPLLRSSQKEAIVVNFPIWACSSRLAVLPSLLRLIKQLSPKVIVSMERGCERGDLPFSHHILNALQYYEALLDSIDAANATSETVSKIEKFLIQPRIESIVLGRLHIPDQTPHWRALFASAGFMPVRFSNFTEIQAECVSKRTHVGGFHVEKRKESLMLCWQRKELISASAWRC